MYYVLAVLCGVIAGIVLDELFGAKVVSEVKAEIHNVKAEIVVALTKELNRLK